MPASSAMAMVMSLEDRAQLVGAAGSRSERAGVEPVAGPRRVDLGQRDGGDDLAGVGFEHEAGGRRRRVARRRQLQLLGKRVLHADVDGQAQRLASACARDPARASTRPVSSSSALDAGQPLVVDVDGAEEVAGERAQRIGALELGAEGQARQPRSCTRCACRGLKPRATQAKRRLRSASDLAQLRLVEAGERGSEPSRSPRRDRE